MPKLLAATALLLLSAAGAVAEEAVRANDIVIAQPWARASIGTGRPGAAYLTITNQGAGPDRLLGVASEIAGSAEVHDSTRDASGVMRMAPAGPLALGAGETVALAPGGKHIMLMELKKPLLQGETLPLLLRFERAGEVVVNAPILGIGARGPEDQ
jgi:copper(I)-binding protein